MASGVGSLEIRVPRGGSWFYSLRDWFVRFQENKLAVVGLVIVVTMYVVAVLAPQIALHDPNLVNVKERLAPLSRNHPLGTDSFGRDLFSRVVYGARISAVVGVGAVTFALFAGVFIGGISGFCGRVVDNVIMRFLDAIMAFPGILLAIALMTVLGASVTNVCIALSIRYMPHFARIVRGSVLKEREKEYVDAAILQGESTGRIIFRQILPNCMAPIIVQASLDFASAILTEAGLSFLGVGVPPPTPSWGSMLQGAQATMEIYPWEAVFPGIAISLCVFGFNLLGDGLRDVFDPRLSEER